MASEQYKGRRLEIILDSIKQKQRIDSKADEKGLPTALFVKSVLLDAVEGKGNASSGPSSDIQRLHKEVLQLRKDLELKELQNEKLERELRQARGTAWRETLHEGSRSFDADLLAALQHGPIQDYNLLEAMGIDAQDVEAIRAVTNQLASLEAMGLIKKSQRGWTWKK